MSAVLENFPGAQRALFRRYHIGGCSSCGFSPDETLTDSAAITARNRSTIVALTTKRTQEVLSDFFSVHGLPYFATECFLIEPESDAARLLPKYLSKERKAGQIRFFVLPSGRLWCGDKPPKEILDSAFPKLKFQFRNPFSAKSLRQSKVCKRHQSRVLKKAHVESSPLESRESVCGYSLAELLLQGLPDSIRLAAG